MSDYSDRDWWTTSKVERMRNEYADAAIDLQNRLTAIQLDISALSAAAISGVGKFSSIVNPDWSTGRIVTGFDSAVDRFKTNLTGVISQMKTAATDLETKLALVNERLRILDQMWVEEDAREEEYLLSDIPF